MTAPQATDADCAAVIVRLPDVVAGQAERETNAQGTGAWGNPASVLLRCGVEPLGPTTDRCVSVDGVDWVIDESDAPRYLFTTFGRTPAVEVLIDNDVVSGTTAIADLSSAVSAIPAEGGCTNVDDAISGRAQLASRSASGSGPKVTRRPLIWSASMRMKLRFTVGIHGTSDASSASAMSAAVSRALARPLMTTLQPSVAP